MLRGGLMVPASEEPAAEAAVDVARWLVSCALIMTAGIASGLTLAFFSLDLLELEVLRRAGTHRERVQAGRVLPFLMARSQHQLLVALLLVNSLANEALPLALDPLVDPLAAVIISVTGVLLFGEILPQALCARHALAISQACTGLATLLMVITAPVSWPLAKLLDWLLELASHKDKQEDEARDAVEGTYQPPALVGPPSAAPDHRPLPAPRPCPPSLCLWGAHQPEWEGEADEEVGLPKRAGVAGSPPEEQGVDTFQVVQMHVQQQLQQAQDLQAEREQGQLQPHIRDQVQQHQQQQQQQEAQQRQQEKEKAVSQLAHALSGGGPTAQPGPDMYELADAAVSEPSNHPKSAAMAEALLDHKKLRALISLHGKQEGFGGQLADDEVKVMLGALDLRFKTARMAMTPLHRVLMLSESTPLTYDTLRLLLARGHSRVPVVRAAYTPFTSYPTFSGTPPAPEAPAKTCGPTAPPASPVATGVAAAGPGVARAAGAGTGVHAPTDSQLPLMAPSPSGRARATPIMDLCHPDGEHKSIPVDLSSPEGLSPDDVLGVLLVKELIMVDFESGHLCVGDVPLRPLPTIHCNTPLLDMMQLFQKGGFHMALLVQKRSQAAKSGHHHHHLHTSRASKRHTSPHQHSKPFPLPHVDSPLHVARGTPWGTATAAATPHVPQDASGPSAAEHVFPSAASTAQPPSLPSCTQPVEATGTEQKGAKEAAAKAGAAEAGSSGPERGPEARGNPERPEPGPHVGGTTPRRKRSALQGLQTRQPNEQTSPLPSPHRPLPSPLSPWPTTPKAPHNFTQPSGSSSAARRTPHPSPLAAASAFAPTTSAQWGVEGAQSSGAPLPGAGAGGGQEAGAQQQWQGGAAETEDPLGLEAWHHQRMNGSREDPFTQQNGCQHQGRIEQLRQEEGDTQSERTSFFGSSEYSTTTGRQYEGSEYPAGGDEHAAQSGLLEALIAQDRAAELATGPYSLCSDTPARNVVSAQSTHTMRTMPCCSTAQTSPNSSLGTSSSSDAPSFCSERPYSPPTPHTFFRQERRLQQHQSSKRMSVSSSLTRTSHHKVGLHGRAHSTSEPNLVAAGVPEALDVPPIHRHHHGAAMAVGPSIPEATEAAAAAADSATGVAAAESTAGGATVSDRAESPKEVSMPEQTGFQLPGSSRQEPQEAQSPEQQRGGTAVSPSIRIDIRGDEQEAGQWSTHPSPQQQQQQQQQEGVHRRKHPEGDDWVVCGIITLEDVIEEMMQVEIIDETDEWIDNTQNVRVSTLRLLASLPPAQRVRAARVRRAATLRKP